MNTTKITAIACLLLCMAACKKEETKITLQEKLSSKTWKSTGLISSGVVKDKWCWLNSLYDFTESGNLYFTQGDDQGACSGGTIGEITNIPYVISADEKYIITQTTFPSAADTYQVVSITDTHLKTKRVINNGTSIWEDTYTAQ